MAEKINSGDVVVIRYEGPKGGPGMREMLSPTSGCRQARRGRGLITDGASPAAPSAWSVGHVAPERVGGTIALIEEGDSITIDAHRLSSG